MAANNRNQQRYAPSDGRIPQRALRRVTWVDHDTPQRKFRSLFNPKQLPISTSAEYGELHAIGWSQPVQQYAHTDAKRYSLSLPVSLRAYQDFGLEFTTVHEAEAYFSSFLYANRIGESPPLLKMIWPKTAIILNTVRQVNITYERWDTDMNVVAYAIDLTLVEIRRSYMRSSIVSATTANGSAAMTLIDPAMRGADVSTRNSNGTGRPLLVSGATTKLRTGGG